MIHLRTNWNGNAPECSVADPAEAVAYMRAHPTGCYEILNPSTPVRPYGDWDQTLSEGSTIETYNSAYDKSVAFLRSIHPGIAIADASSFQLLKVSFHWTIPNERVESTAHAKQYAHQLYGSEKQAFADFSVYDSRKKFRTCYSSKPRQHRPLLPLGCEPADTIVQFVPPDARHIPIELPLKKLAPPKPAIAGAGADIPPRHIEEDQTIFTIAECVATWRWTDYAMCRNLIWALCDGGANRSVIHHYAKKGANYSEAWVDNIIAAYNPNLQCRITYGTLRHFAKEDDPIAVKRFEGLVASVSVEEITRLKTDEATLFDWCDERGFLRPLPDMPTLLVKSHMGTGKTTQMKACAVGAPNVLILTARQSYADMIGADFSKYADYRKLKKGEDINTHDFLIMSVQSIHKIKRDYDLVFLDECETLLASCSPNTTHHTNYLANVMTLERIVRTAKCVVAMDAFVTERSRMFLTALRPFVQMVVNPTLPYARTSLLFSKDKGGRDGFNQHLLDLVVKSNKKVISVFGTKPDTDIMRCVPEGVSAEIYHKDTDAKVKATHFADVNKYWAERQWVGYTPVVTIGLNYQGTPSFDICSFTQSTWGATMRDAAQALHRARKLNDNHIVGFVETTPHRDFTTLDAGMKAMEQYHNEDTVQSTALLRNLGEKVPDYERLPNWLIRILLFNRNEQVTNKKYPRECAEYYLKACGVTLTYTTLPVASFLKKSLSEAVAASAIDLNNIPIMCDDEADILMRGQFSTELSQLDQLKIQKYRLAQFIPADTIDGNLMMKWLDTPHLVENAYNEKHSSPATLLQKLNTQNGRKVIDLLSPEIKQLDIIQSLKLDYTNEICIPIKDVPVIDLTPFNIRKRTTKTDKAQYCRTLARAINTFNGSQINVSRKRVRVDGVLDYEYYLTYNPRNDAIVSYIPKKADFRTLLRDES